MAVSKPRPSQRSKPVFRREKTSEEISVCQDEEFLRDERRRVINALAAFAARITEIDELSRPLAFSQRQELHEERENLVAQSNTARQYGDEIGQRLHRLEKAQASTV